MGPISIIRLALWMSAASSIVAAPAAEPQDINELGDAVEHTEPQDLTAFGDALDTADPHDIVDTRDIEARAVIGHDKVVGFPTSVPGGAVGALYKKHQPFLKVFHGCVPFPAVNRGGDTSGGLKETGAHNGKCSKNKGQVYARQGSYGGRRAIMYAWYMPKDSPSSGLGHRHDWESIVVWLDRKEATTKAKVAGVAVSGHGKFDKKKARDVRFSGSRPLIAYNSQWPMNHRLYFTPQKGGQQPLIAYEKLTNAARKALEKRDFKSANVPFINKNFANNLKKAAL
ncbi:25 kDa protein elicitor [Paramyrothecium foliicola]|nr:25 kDa protein elicitor [Paramyrothecium foliicola]